MNLTTTNLGEQQGTPVEETKEVLGDLAEALSLSKQDTLLQKFNELPADKRDSYLHTVFGTVRGTTGFFDTWFTRGTRGFKVFDLPQYGECNAIITLWGDYSDEGGGGENNNYITVLWGNKKYSSEGINFRNSKGKPHVEREDQEYKEILSCAFEEKSDTFTLEVTCADGSTKQIKATFDRIYEFEEDVLGKLWVPPQLLVAEEKNSDVKESISIEPPLTDPEILKREMNQRIVDIFCLKKHFREIGKYLEQGNISLNEEQKKKYLQYLIDKYGERYGDKSEKDAILPQAISLLEGVSDAKFVQDMCRAFLKLTSRKENILALEEQLVTVGKIDKLEYQTNKLNTMLSNGQGYWGDNRSGFRLIENFIGAFDEAIVAFQADEKEWYNKLLNSIYADDGFFLHVGQEKSNNILSRLSEVLGMDKKMLERDIFIQNLSQVQKWSRWGIKQRIDWIKKEGYTLKEIIDVSIVEKIFASPEIMDEDGLKNYHSDEWKMFLPLLQELKDEFGINLSQDFFVKLITKVSRRGEERKKKGEVLMYQEIWNKYGSGYSADEKEKILEQLSDIFVQPSNHCHVFSETDLIRWGLVDPQRILTIFEHLLDKKWDIKKADCLLELIEDKPFFNDELRQQIHALYKQTTNAYCKGKKTEDTHYCDPYLEQCASYADGEEVKHYCQTKLEEWKQHIGKRHTRDKIFYFEHIATCWMNAKLAFSEMQTIIEGHIQKGEYQIAANYIEGFGMDMDKVWVNSLVSNLFESGEFDGTEKVARAAGLWDLWKKKVEVKRMESGCMDPYYIEKNIKEFDLDPSYHSCSIDKYFSRGEFERAVKYAEEQNIIITPQQFDTYITKHIQI